MQHRMLESDEVRAPESVPHELHGSLEALIECLPDAVLVLDRHASVLALNAAASALLGEPPRAILGRSLHRLLAPTPADRLARLVAPSSSDPVMRSDACSLQTQHGVIPVHVTLAELSLQRERLVVATLTEPSLARGTTRFDHADQNAQAARQSAEQRMRDLTESLPQLVWTCRPDGACDLVNHRWLEFTGVAESEQLGFGWLRQVHPDDVEQVHAIAAHSRARGEPYELDYRLRRHDGVYRWFNAHAIALKDGNGDIFKWLGANTEVHEARELRERLRVEQERLATIIEYSPDVVVSYERDREGRTRFTFVSASAHTLYGLTPAQLEADEQQLFSRIHPDDLGRVRESVEASARDGVPLFCEFRYQHPTEGEKWLEGRSVPRFNPDGSIVWCGLVTDTTRRKLAEEELKLTRAQLESALEAAEMGAWLWDYESNILWGSEGMRRIWHLPDSAPAWFDPKLVSKWMHPDDIVRVLADSAASVASGQRLETEYRILTPEGGERWIASRARVERSADGRTHRLAGVNLDVTQHKLRAETTLRSQKLESLGTLAGGIAHDFNNVLFAISGNVALALDALSPDHRARTFLEQVSSASQRAIELVRQILAFSRPHEQKLEVLRLAAPVQEAMLLVRATIPTTVDIHVELDPHTPSALIDVARVVQVIVNLCANAAHAIGKERAGSLDVRLHPLTLTEPSGDVPAGSYAILSVRDDGSGMSEATQARIFDPFFTTKAPGEGTGLGLSVVHGILKALGAYLTVWSQLGQGTLFRVYFPAMPDAAAADPTVHEPSPSGAGKRVLFVDDESMLVRLGTSFLELLGYRPSAFQDPHEALAAFRREPAAFAAVVTDLSMPVMSGFDLVRSLRALRHDVPVLAMSGYLGPEERKLAEQLGIAELAIKPLTVAQLGDHLARLCADARDASSLAAAR
jgi:PAS domain S-box-containing protein